MHRLEVLGIELTTPGWSTSLRPAADSSGMPQTDLRSEKLALRCRYPSGRGRRCGLEVVEPRAVLVVQLRLFEFARESRVEEGQAPPRTWTSAPGRAPQGCRPASRCHSSPWANALLFDGSAIASTNFMNAWTASLSALNVGSPSKIGSGSLKPSVSWRNDPYLSPGLSRSVRADRGTWPVCHSPPSVRRIVLSTFAQRGTAAPQDLLERDTRSWDQRRPVPDAAPRTSQARLRVDRAAASSRWRTPRVASPARSSPFSSRTSAAPRVREELDPESLRQITYRYFEETKAVLGRHGGTVEKFIGDAVVAVFGVPLAHEDDALRAVRAAAELREMLEDLNQEFTSAPGASPSRCGWASTPVGDRRRSGRRHVFVTGDAVNLAARFEQSAKPGEILIGETTLRLVRNAVVAEDAGPLVLKGKREPVPAWRVIEVTAGAVGWTRQLDSRLVDRETELTLCRSAYERAIEQGS